MTDFLHRYRLPILSGILIGTSYIPSYPLNVFWSFVPLWIYWIRQNPSVKQVFFSGWITQFILTLIGFYWVAHTAHEFGHLPWSLAILALIGFCSLANLHVVLSGLLWKWIASKRNPSIALSGIFLATTTILGELFFPMIFPWNHGYVWLWAGWEGYQWADIIGIQGLSAICLFGNAFFLWLISSKDKKRIGIGFAGFAALFLIFNLTGKMHGKKWDETDRSTRILIVQANIGNMLKFFAEEGDVKATATIAEKYFQLTREAIEDERNNGGQIDYVFWPETAYPEYLNPIYRNMPYHRKLKGFVRSLDIPFIVGGHTNDYKNRQIYNSVFFIEKNGRILDPPYSKSILLAFGEYFPGAETFPFLKKLVPAISDFKRGPGPKIWNFYDINFGPQICYEGLYPDFTRQLARKEAQIIFNLTNDSWFGDMSETYQHLYMTLGRTLESRRPLIRSTNTGISTVVLANGDILEKSPIREEWSKVYDVPFKSNPSQTFFTQYGYYIRHFFIGVFVLILLRIFRGSKNQNTVVLTSNPSTGSTCFELTASLHPANSLPNKFWPHHRSLRPTMHKKAFAKSKKLKPF